VQALSVPRTCPRSSDDLTAEVKNIVRAKIDSKSVVLPARLKYPEQGYPAHRRRRRAIIRGTAPSKISPKAIILMTEQQYPPEAMVASD
jgi:hypothetical protein